MFGQVCNRRRRTKARVPFVDTNGRQVWRAPNVLLVATEPFFQHDHAAVKLKYKQVATHTNTVMLNYDQKHRFGTWRMYVDV